MTPATAASALFLCAALVAQQGAPFQQGGTSPRIERLRRDVTARTPNAVEGFWTEVRRAQGPIVEPAPGDASRELVTFVWRGDRDTKSVSVLNMSMVAI